MRNVPPSRPAATLGDGFGFPPPPPASTTTVTAASTAIRAAPAPAPIHTLRETPGRFSPAGCVTCPAICPPGACPWPGGVHPGCPGWYGTYPGGGGGAKPEGAYGPGT